MGEEVKGMKLKLKMLLDKKKWADCSFHFATDDMNEIKAHKLILATASPVFRAMFYGEMATNLPVDIKDIRPEVFKLVLDYIYTETCTFPDSDEIYDLYYAAEKYMLPILKKLCLDRVIECLDASNACKNYEHAKFFNIPALIRRTEMMILLTDTSAVLAAESIADVQFSTLLMILDNEELNVSSEAELFDAVIRWGRKECERKGLPVDTKNLRAMLDPALKKIHFLTYSSDDFIKGTLQTEIFTNIESLSVLQRIAHRSATFPMLEGFSVQTEKRTAGSCDRLFPDEPEVSELQPDVNEHMDWPQGIVERFQYLLQSEQFSDCSFAIAEEGKAQPRLFRAHRLILYIICPTFYNFWLWANTNDLSGETESDESAEEEEEDFNEKGNNEPVKLDKMSPNPFKCFLDFIYTEKCNLPDDSDEISELVEAANTHCLALLVDKCVSKLVSMKNTFNAIKIYRILERVKVHKTFLNLVGSFILSHISKILMEPSFLDINFHWLSALLNADAMNISSEIELFEATMRWARKECQRRVLPEDHKNLRTVTNSALKKIRFLALTAEEFAKGPALSDILTESERLHILVNIADPSTELPMPEGFSTKGKRDNTRYRKKSTS